MEAHSNWSPPRPAPAQVRRSQPRPSRRIRPCRSKSQSRRQLRRCQRPPKRNCLRPRQPHHPPPPRRLRSCRRRRPPKRNCLRPRQPHHPPPPRRLRSCRRRRLLRLPPLPPRLYQRSRQRLQPQRFCRHLPPPLCRLQRGRQSRLRFSCAATPATRAARSWWLWESC